VYRYLETLAMLRGTCLRRYEHKCVLTFLKQCFPKNLLKKR